MVNDLPMVYVPLFVPLFYAMVKIERLVTTPNKNISREKFDITLLVRCSQKSLITIRSGSKIDVNFRPSIGKVWLAQISIVEKYINQ